MRWLARLWSRDKGLALLAVAVPLTIAAGLGWSWLQKSAAPEVRPPEFRVDLAEMWRGSEDSEPTVGMRFLASRYGTVTDAPVVRAPMVDGRVGRGSLSLMVHEDVAAFIRAWPGAILLDPGIRPEMTTLDLKEEDFPQGARLILREGCLRAVKTGWDGERLVLPFGNTDLFRDPEGYLAVGTADGAAEYRLRVGEPGGLLWLSPVDDAQLEGVAEFRKLCGNEPIVLLAAPPKRLPDCSAAYLEKFADERRVYDAAFEAQKDEALACRAVNEKRNAQELAKGGAVTPPVPCPPNLPPPPPPAAIGGEICRHPDVPVEAD